MNRWTTPWPRLMGPQSKCYRVCADYGTWAACLPDRPDQDQQRVRRPGLPEADGAWRRDRFRVPDTELAGRAVRGDTAPGWGPGSTRSNRNPVRLWVAAGYVVWPALNSTNTCSATRSTSCLRAARRGCGHPLALVGRRQSSNDPGTMQAYRRRRDCSTPTWPTLTIPKGPFMSQPPMPPGPPTEPLPQPRPQQGMQQPWPQQGMPPGGPWPTYGPVPGKEPEERVAETEQRFDLHARSRNVARIIGYPAGWAYSPRPFSSRSVIPRSGGWEEPSARSSGWAPLCGLGPWIGVAGSR